MKNFLLISLLSFSAVVYGADDSKDATSQNTEKATTDANSNKENSTDDAIAVTERVIPNTQQDVRKDLAQLLQNSMTQVIKLEALEETFDLYYVAADEKEPIGSLLFFPDERTHADWPVSLNPLRNGLARHKWQTAVVTLPSPKHMPIPDRSVYTTENDSKKEEPVDIAKDENAEAVETPEKAADETKEESLTAATDSSDETEEPKMDKTPDIPIKTMAERVAARASVSANKLKEKSDVLIITGIGQGATWAMAYALTMSEADKEKTRLLLINPQQSEDVSAPLLNDMIAQLKIDTFDIYTPQNKQAENMPNKALMRKRAANQTEIDEYLQIKAPKSAWSKQGNQWLFRKVRGLLKTKVEPMLAAEAEKKMEPEKAEKMNQKPGSS